MTKIKMVCSECGGEDVVKDAWASWSEENQEWELLTTFDNTYCNDCEESHELKEEPIDG